jgi:hypothetical protein
MIGWPIWAWTCSSTARGKMSVALPGVYGTMTRIGFDGHDCADDGAGGCAEDCARPPPAVVIRIAAAASAATANFGIRRLP